MSKNIEFKARTKHGFETQIKPTPAAKFIPDWWKNYSIYDKDIESPNGDRLVVRDGATNYTFKKCTPMLDALTSGYIVSLWADVLVTRSGEDKEFSRINWRTQSAVFTSHGNSSKDVEPPAGYLNEVYKFHNTWVPITPPGYSCLITSPFGYRNLPLQAVPAIIDTDKSLLDVSPPMWLKKDFEGIIEKGTPILQITPFKRENWQSTFGYFEGDDHAIELERGFSATLVGHYIKNIWSKKTYK